MTYLPFLCFTHQENLQGRYGLEEDLSAQSEKGQTQTRFPGKDEYPLGQGHYQETQGQGEEEAHHLMDQSFPKAFRLLKREEFKRVYARGRRVVGRYVLIHALPNTLGHPRLGITVTKKSGKAVVRNRWKRLIREAFRKNKGAFPPVDMVVTVKRGAGLPTYQELERDMLNLARQL